MHQNDSLYLWNNSRNFLLSCWFINKLKTPRVLFLLLQVNPIKRSSFVFILDKEAMKQFRDVTQIISCSPPESSDTRLLLLLASSFNTPHDSLVKSLQL